MVDCKVIVPRKNYRKRKRMNVRTPDCEKLIDTNSQTKSNSKILIDFFYEKHISYKSILKSDLSLHMNDSSDLVYSDESQTVVSPREKPVKLVSILPKKCNLSQQMNSSPFSDHDYSLKISSNNKISENMKEYKAFVRPKQGFKKSNNKTFKKLHKIIHPHDDDKLKNNSSLGFKNSMNDRKKDCSSSVGSSKTSLHEKHLKTVFENLLSQKYSHEPDCGCIIEITPQNQRNVSTHLKNNMNQALRKCSLILEKKEHFNDFESIIKDDKNVFRSVINDEQANNEVNLNKSETKGNICDFSQNDKFINDESTPETSDYEKEFSAYSLTGSLENNKNESTMEANVNIGSPVLYLKNSSIHENEIKYISLNEANIYSIVPISKSQQILNDQSEFNELTMSKEPLPDDLYKVKDSEQKSDEMLSQVKKKRIPIAVNYHNLIGINSTDVTKHQDFENTSEIDAKTPITSSLNCYDKIEDNLQSSCKSSIEYKSLHDSRDDFLNKDGKSVFLNNWIDSLEQEVSNDGKDNLCNDSFENKYVLGTIYPIAYSSNASDKVSDCERAQDHFSVFNTLPNPGEVPNVLESDLSILNLIHENASPKGACLKNEISNCRNTHSQFNDEALIFDGYDEWETLSTNSFLLNSPSCDDDIIEKILEDIERHSNESTSITPVDDLNFIFNLENSCNISNQESCSYSENKQSDINEKNDFNYQKALNVCLDPTYKILRKTIRLPTHPKKSKLRKLQITKFKNDNVKIDFDSNCSRDSKKMMYFVRRSLLTGAVMIETLVK